MVQRPDIPRSKFTGSWSRKTTFDAGYLVPFLCDEILPGDHMKYDVTAYIRMSTPLFPILDNQRIDTFFFFVPNRIVWANWKLFMGEVPDPTTTLPTNTVPQVEPLLATVNTVCTVWDYMGIPTGNFTSSMAFSALPFRAYNLIYNDWFRDENLINSATVNTGNGPDDSTTFPLRKRAKSHDYFTSALPWPQKFTAPTVALGGQAWVKGIGIDVLSAGAAAATIYESGASASTAYANQKGASAYYVEADTVTNYPEIYADLQTATGVSINVLRQAFLVQQLLERDARGGTRYTEIVRSHFGVTSPDMRLQRPEYIGGGSSPLIITPVAQTATGGSGVGALGGAGTSAGQHKASFAATEHGYIIGLINVKSELSYSQGMPRHFRRLTRYDFYWPSLDGLGEQEILRSEIYAIGTPALDDTVFGYQERWHEYRTRTSEVTGYFRPKIASNIDEWHLSQEFSAAPTLGQTFIEDTPPMARILSGGALASGLQYLGDIHIHREATRPISTFGTPVKLGRF